MLSLITISEEDWGGVVSLESAWLWRSHGVSAGRRLRGKLHLGTIFQPNLDGLCADKR